jgi:hypothetical protein
MILKIDFILCRCGLRYARSRAKKEGPLAPPGRRRKDKSDLSKRESATPPSYAPYPTPAPKGSPRRSFNHAPSSHSGSEVYGSHFQHHQRQNQHVLNPQLSPSPPPSASGSTSVNLVQYAGGHGQRHELQHRASSYSTTSNTLYPPSSPVPPTPYQNYPHSIPSPSVTNVYHQPRAHHPHHTVSHPQLPPLDQIKPPHAYEHERDMREQQSSHQGQQQRMPLPLLSAGEAREYRR